MKRTLLQLLIASPILSTLAPHANAGAVTLDYGTLRPQLLGPAAFHQSTNGSVPTGAIKLPRPAGSSNEMVPTVFGNALYGGTLNLGAVNQFGGVMISGAGTLWLNGSNTGFYGSRLQFLGGNSGAVLLPTRPSTLVSDALLTNTEFNLDTTIGPVFSVSQTLSVNQITGLPILNTGGITLNGGNLGMATGTLAVTSGNLLTSGLVNTGAGTLTLGNGTFPGGGIIVFGNENGAVLLHGGGVVNPNAGTLVTSPSPAAAPVPEPGTAILFALGMLTAGQARRRRV